MVDVTIKLVLVLVVLFFAVWIIIFVSLKSPKVQETLRGIVVNSLGESLDAELTVGDFQIGFPNGLDVGSVLVYGDKPDTLAYIGQLSVSIELLPLLQKEISLDQVVLKNARGYFGELVSRLSTDTGTSGGNGDDGWDFSIKELLVDDSFIDYTDEEEGFRLLLDIGHVEIVPHLLDFDSLISFGSVNVSNTDVGFQWLYAVQGEDDTSGYASIFIDKASLSGSSFGYIDSASSVIFNIESRKVIADKLLVDINNEDVSFDKGQIVSSSFNLKFLVENDSFPDNDDYLNWGQHLWGVRGHQLVLDDFRFVLNDENEPLLEGHFDNNHMDIYGIKGQIADFVVDEDTLAMKINSLVASERNGFEVEGLHAELQQDGAVFKISDLNMTTSNATYGLALATNLSPTNYQTLEDKDLLIDLIVEGDNFRDVDFFYALDSLVPSSDLLQTKFDLSAKVGGSFDSIAVGALSFVLDDSVKMALSGKLGSLLVTDSLTFDLDFDEVLLSKQEIEKLIPGLIPDSVQGLPNFLLVTGRCKGTPDFMDFSGTLDSDVGQFEVYSLKMGLADTTALELAMRAENVNVAFPVSNPVYNGAFALEASFSGNDLYSAKAGIKMRVDSFGYNGHNYEAIAFNADLNQGVFNSTFNSGDSAFNVAFVSGGMLKRDKQQLDFTLDVVKLDLKELNFYGSELDLNGKCSATFEGYDKGGYGLGFSIHEMSAVSPDSIYNVEPLEFNFMTDDVQSSLVVVGLSNRLDVNANASSKEILHSAEGFSASYDSISLGYLKDLPTFTAKGQLTYPRAIVGLFAPGFPSFDKLIVDVSHQKEADKFNASFALSDVTVASVGFGELGINLHGSSVGIDYQFGVGVGEKKTVSDLLLRGKLQDSAMNCNLTYLDGFSNQFLNLTAIADWSDVAINIHLVPDSLIVNYNKWSLNPDNELSLRDSGIFTHNFSVYKDDKFISIESDSLGTGQDLEIEFADIDLGALENLFQTDTIVDGTATGKFTILDLYGTAGLTGNLTIDSISVFGFEAGELRLEKFLLNSELVKGDVLIKGSGDDIDLSVNYLFNDLAPLDIDIEMESLQLQDLNYLFSDYIRNAKGSLKGGLRVNGTLEEPVVNGKLSFDNASLGILALNNHFSLGDELITIDDNLVDFGSLVVKNENGRKAKLSGQVSLSSKNASRSNLSLVTEKMEIMNTTSDDSDVFYGFLEARSNMKLTGPFDKLQLSANLEIDKSTDVTYVFPDDLSINDNKGVVRFRSAGPDSAGAHLEDELPQKDVFLDYSSFEDIKTEVLVDEGAFFHLFFDGGGNDYLEATIDGKLHYDYYEGTTNISGMFTVGEGKLHYSIPMVTVNDFKIEEGSYIAVSNDLSNPTLNIIASSKIRASTEGLLTDYNKVMNFKVLLYMTGELNNLKLKFDISTETNDAIVSARLEQLSEEERNINALNLMVRGAFLITLNGNDAGSSTMLSAQIDKFYANQLNHLISENIKFVDLHFDVQSFSDYGIEGSQVFRRNYYYNIGKTFFKDRARVSYKGSLSLSTDLQADNVNSSFVENELNVVYKINKSGSLEAVFFRKNKYQGLLEGEIVETGGGFQLRKSFYKFKDVFRRKKSTDNYLSGKREE